MNLSLKTPGRARRASWPVTLWLYGVIFTGLCLMRAPLFAQSDGLPRGAQFPYTRYESENGRMGGGAVLQQSLQFVQTDIASEASNQKYVSLPASGAYVEWPVSATAQALNLRFTMPDNASGTGLTGSLGLYVNRVKVSTINLSSYWAYQYFSVGGSDPSQTVQTKTFMRFDEVHFQLGSAVHSGDTIRVQKENGDGNTYGVDFIELEPLPAFISQPGTALSVTSYGAVADDNNDDFAAFNACISAAVAQGKSVYIPPGKFLLSDKLTLNVSNLKIQGAGIWYTQIYFSSPKQFYGGIYARASNVELSDFSMNTANNGRLKYNEANARVPGDPYIIYKAFEGTYGANSKIHDVWEEHFECGFWIAGYDPPFPVDITQNLVISNCRIRNNYADGVNFCQGTSNSTVMNCSIRNNGDDGMAVWPNNDAGVTVPAINNNFHNNTVENNWRAGGTALFGGYGHQVHHNVYKDGVAGSAIRMTNDFSGFTFDNTKTVTRIYENTITGCGTSYDIWNQKRGAIELYANTGIFNLQFDNNDINNSQRDAIQLQGVNIYNMVFNNTHIDGTGLDPVVRDVPSDVYGGFGIYCAANSQTATFNKLTVLNSESGTYINRNTSFQLIFQDVNVPVTSVSISPAGDTTLGSGQTLQLNALVVPTDATNKIVNWTVSDATVATVDASGKVTAVGIGAATITVTTQDGAKTAAKRVTVTPAVNVTATDETAGEGGNTGTFVISTVGITQPVTVTYTLSGTASAADYNASPALTGSVTLTPAVPSQAIVVTPVDDNNFEGPETLKLTLGAGGGYQLGGHTAATIAIADNDNPPCVSPVVAQVTGSAPVIDQTIEASWAAAPVRGISNIVLGGLPAGYSGQWWAQYDNTNLYVLVQVNDATRVNDSGGSWYDDDAVELFIDADNSKGSTYDGVNDFQLGFRWNDATVHVGGNSVTNTTGIRFSLYATGTGYNLEAAIPWSTLGTTPSIGKPLGLDVQLDNDDNGGTRDAQAASFATTTTAFQNPSVLGTVYLTTCSGGGGNQAPVANAGVDQTLAAGTGSVTLQGSGSDPDGNTITYSWTKVSGPSVTFSNAAIANPVVSGLTNGSTYVFQLTVNDGTLTASDQVQISVGAGGGSQPGMVTANLLSGTLSINGSLSEAAWRITNPVTKSVIGTANNTVTYGVLWDNTNLYIGVKVLDASLHGNTTDLWNGDAVEIMIDANNNKLGSYDGRDNQLIQAYNSTALFSKVSVSGVQHAWAPISGGYSVEMAIPWSQLGLTPTAGLTIGLDIANDDDDTGGGRTMQSVWFGTINDYQSTADFGTLVLGSGTGASVVTGLSAGVGKELVMDSAGIRVQLLPNPVRNGMAKAIVTGTFETFEVRVHDLAGRQVYSTRGRSPLDMNLSGLGRGIYIVSLVVDGRRVQKKLLVE